MLDDCHCTEFDRVDFRRIGLKYNTPDYGFCRELYGLTECRMQNGECRMRCGPGDYGTTRLPDYGTRGYLTAASLIAKSPLSASRVAWTPMGSVALWRT